MSASLKSRFEDFLINVFGAESVDASHVPTKQDPMRADYYLADRRIVAEVKSLEVDPTYKGSVIINDYLEDTGIEVFGTLPLSRVVRNQQHGQDIDTAIYRRISRGVERICSKADKQLGTEFKKLPALATGLLIILNEAITSLHPSLVAERVTEFTSEKPRNIHFCLLAFESHKTCVNGAFLPYPILIDLSRSARQRRSLGFLSALQWRWAQQYGHLQPIKSDAEHPVVYHPDSLTFGE